MTWQRKELLPSSSTAAKDGSPGDEAGLGLLWVSGAFAPTPRPQTATSGLAWSLRKPKDRQELADTAL